jgi:branched-chain amino acid transport system permease protein
MSRWLVMWGITLVLGLCVPFVFGNFLTNLIALVWVSAISVLGLNYIIRNTGQVSLGHASIQAIGAYAGGISVVTFHAPAIIAFIVAPVCSGIFGLILAVSSIRLNGPYFAVVSLVLGWAVAEALTLFSGITGGYQGLYVQQFTIFASPVVTIYFLALILFMISIFIVRNIQISKYGKALLVMKKSPQAATSLGVNVVRFKIISITIGNIFAGLSGVLYVYLVSAITPEAFGFSQSAYYLVASVVGGTLSPFGALLGSIVTVCLPTFMSSLQYYASALLGLLLIVVLAFLPGGLSTIGKRFRVAKGKIQKSGDVAGAAEH